MHFAIWEYRRRVLLSNFSLQTSVGSLRHLCKAHKSGSSLGSITLSQSLFRWWLYRSVEGKFSVKTLTNEDESPNYVWKEQNSESNETECQFAGKTGQ